MKSEKNFLVKISDKSAVEDYKNLKSEIGNLSLASNPKKLTYQPIRVRSWRNK